MAMRVHPLHELPVELLNELCKYLNLKELNRFSQVDRLHHQKVTALYSAAFQKAKADFENAQALDDVNWLRYLPAAAEAGSSRVAFLKVSRQQNQDKALERDQLLATFYLNDADNGAIVDGPVTCNCAIKIKDALLSSCAVGNLRLGQAMFAIACHRHEIFTVTRSSLNINNILEECACHSQLTRWMMSLYPSHEAFNGLGLIPLAGPYLEGSIPAAESLTTVTMECDVPVGFIPHLHSEITNTFFSKAYNDYGKRYPLSAEEIWREGIRMTPLGKNRRTWEVVLVGRAEAFEQKPTLRIEPFAFKPVLHRSQARGGGWVWAEGPNMQAMVGQVTACRPYFDIQKIAP